MRAFPHDDSECRPPDAGLHLHFTRSAPRRPVLGGIVVLCAALIAPGCDADDPVDPPVTAGDTDEPEQPPPPDAGRDAELDAEPDAAAPDARSTDAEPDLDAVAPDGAGDVGPPPDALPDPSADAAPDAITDGAAPDTGPPPPVIHLAPGRFAPGAPVAFDLPAGLQSILIQARGAPDGVYGVESVEGPAGPLIPPSRTTVNPEVAVALLPDTGAVAPLPAGRYVARLVAAGADDRPLDVEVYGVAGAGRRLTVNLFVPPAIGRGPDDPAVQAMAVALEGQLLAGFGLQSTVEVAALADDAPAELAIDGLASDFGGLSDLGRAAPDAGPGLDLYLVRRITDGGNPITGFSGGLPAPTGLRGTAASVTAVPASLIDDFPDAVADRGVHELGHALGLFHTTEAFGGRWDPIPDTPECPDVCDADGDGVLFARECGARDRGEAPCRGAADNLMFWTFGGDRAVTAGQRAVVRRHPAVEP